MLCVYISVLIFHSRREFKSMKKKLMLYKKKAIEISDGEQNVLVGDMRYYTESIYFSYICYNDKFNCMTFCFSTYMSTSTYIVEKL